jgi:hypothetical protein
VVRNHHRHESAFQNTFELFDNNANRSIGTITLAPHGSTKITLQSSQALDDGYGLIQEQEVRQRHLEQLQSAAQRRKRHALSRDAGVGRAQTRSSPFVLTKGRPFVASVSSLASGQPG